MFILPSVSQHERDVFSEKQNFIKITKIYLPHAAQSPLAHPQPRHQKCRLTWYILEARDIDFCRDFRLFVLISDDFQKTKS